MHKDKPPGLFDFPHRSVGHGIGLGLGLGVLLSLIVHLGLLVRTAERKTVTSEPPLVGGEGAKNVIARPVEKDSSSPVSAVRY